MAETPKPFSSAGLRGAAKQAWRDSEGLRETFMADPAPPPQYVCVPVEPTESMKNAGDDLLDDTVECAHNVWNAMLAASPNTHVAISRELLERTINLLAQALANLADHPQELPVSHEVLAEVRALLLKQATRVGEQSGS